MLTVCCVYTKSAKYNEDYVIKLRSMVLRNLSKPHNFVCLTKENVPFVDCITPPEDLPGWWGKLNLFHPNTDLGGDVLYFDLDTVILKNIDMLVDLPGTFIARRSVNTKPGMAKRMSSSIMRWRGEFSSIWTHFNNNRNRINFNLDEQSIIQNVVNDIWVDMEDILPEDFILEWMYDELNIIYEQKNLDAIYPNCAIICFGGEPKPHELANANQIVMEHWQ